MPEAIDNASQRTVGIRDIPLVVFAPRRLFRRAQDVVAYAWPMVVLLTAVTLVGYAIVQTGLIDREVQQRVDGRIAEIEQQQRDVVERSALRDLYEQEHKRGAFELLLTRIRVVVAEPLSTLGSILLIAAVLYGVVALTGRKVEWHTLMTICVLASFIDLLGQVVVLALMLHYRTLEVFTSLAVLPALLPETFGKDPTRVAALTGLLSAADPFRMWFWWVVRVGLSATAQLPGWRAWVVCSLGWLVGAGVRCGLAVAAASAAGMSGSNQ